VNKLIMPKDHVVHVFKLQVWRDEEPAEEGRRYGSFYLEAVLGTEVLESRQLFGADGITDLYGGVERLREKRNACTYINVFERIKKASGREPYRIHHFCDRSDLTMLGLGEVGLVRAAAVSDQPALLDSVV